MTTDVEKILKFIADNDIKDSVTWDNDLNFYILCNDVFFWGAADLEELTVDSLPVLEQALKDCEDYADILYCCRRRKMRPQGAMYKMFEPEIWYLFHECGEEREVGIDNPYDPEEFLTQKETQ